MPGPTHIRYLIVLAAMLAAVLLYLERVCVSVAEVYIREDLRIGRKDGNAQRQRGRHEDPGPPHQDTPLHSPPLPHRYMYGVPRVCRRMAQVV